MSNRMGHRGYSLIEMLVYVAILAVVSVAVVQTFLTLIPAYSQLRAARKLDHGAEAALERMTHDIHTASAVVSGQSTLNAHPGRLTLTIPGGNTVEYYLEGGALKVKDNGVAAGSLTPGVNISSLIFRTASNSRSTFIKIEITASTTAGKTTRVENYFGGATLRGTY